MGGIFKGGAACKRPTYPWSEVEFAKIGSASPTAQPFGSDICPKGVNTSTA